MKARRSVSASASRAESGRIGDEMRHFDVRLVLSRLRRWRRSRRCSAPISVSTNIFEKAGCALSDAVGTQHQFGKGGHLDVPVGGAVIVER